MRSIISISIIICSLVFFSLLMDRIAQGFNVFPQYQSQNLTRNCKTMKGFTITAYCPGKCCNGRWAGQTASGKTMQYYKHKGIRIMAVDPRIIPLGSVIIYNNTEYHAVDTGSKIKGFRLDVHVESHEDTLKFGIKKNQSLQVFTP